MISFPHAKINIGLRILSKRPDGYHNIRSVLVPIPFTDVLEVIPTEGEMKYDFGQGWNEAPEDNLVVKAYRAIEKFRDLQLPPVEIILRKKIPSGAGLGGGSSDATHMLMMLNDLFELRLTADDLHDIAKSLGADCPFFLSPQPQLAEGIGDLLSPYPINLKGWYLTLLLSDISVSTKEAYEGVKPNISGDDIGTSLSLPIDKWRGLVRNQFEPHIFNLHPELRIGKELLYQSGATYAAMSGSGSTLYALSDHPLSVNGWGGQIWTSQL